MRIGRSAFKYLEKNGTPFYTSRISQNNGISKNHHVLPGLSVVLVQLLKGCKLFFVSCYFCQTLAPFNILRFSHHFFHFAADFVTLSCTKIAISFNPFGRSLPIYSTLKGVPLYPADANWLGGPSQVQVIVLLMCIKTSWTVSLALNQAKISSNVPGETIQFFPYIDRSDSSDLHL